MGNRFGMGPSSVVPQEIGGWDWGAFLLNWLGGIGNRTYIALLCFVPVLNVVMPFVRGAKGNERAWRNKKGEGVEHFKRVQRRWGWTGLIVLVGSVLFVVVLLGAILTVVGHSEPYVMALERVRSDTQVVEALGTPITPGWWVSGTQGMAAISIPVAGPDAKGTAHIQQHLDDPLPLDELARIACFSPFHFRRIFKGLVVGRFKKRGMKWSRRGAANLLALRTLKTNRKDWDTSGSRTNYCRL